MADSFVASLLYRGITRGRSPLTEAVSLAARLTELERVHGSAAAAARAAGVSARTWQRWRVALAGESATARERQRPSKASEAKITQAIRRGRFKPGREARLRKGRTLRVTGEFRVSSDVRERSLDIGPFVPKRIRDGIFDAFLAGDDSTMVRLFSQAMNYYLQDMEVVSLISIDFE